MLEIIKDVLVVTLYVVGGLATIGFIILCFGVALIKKAADDAIDPR